MPRTNGRPRRATQFELSMPSHADSNIVRQFMEQLRNRPPRAFNRGQVVLNRVQVRAILANPYVSTDFPGDFKRRLENALWSEGKLFRLTAPQKTALSSGLYYAKCAGDLCDLLTKLCDTIQ
jgi:hypothetical protein